MHYPLISNTLGSEEEKAILGVLRSGQVTMGPRVREFETHFSSYFGMKHAVMVNSGSSANLIAVASLFYRKENALKPGDEVIVPCVSWSTTYYPLQQYGLKMKFVDVDLETLNYDVAELKKAISPKTRMVVAVSILGNPCPFDEIAQICRDKNLILFEDCCESMGAKFEGKYAGTFGLLNTFSTFFTHQISTIEGGLVLTDDKEIYNLLLSLRNHGWTRDQEPDSPIFERSKNDFYEAYRFILPGYNLRPSEIQGALGTPQLEKLAGYIRARRQNAHYFKEVLGRDQRFLLQREIGESSWFSFPIIVNPDSGMTRARVFEALKKAGIEYRQITGGNILRHDVRKYFDYTCEKMSNADIVHDHGFFVGNHPKDMRASVDLLCKTLKSLCWKGT